MSQAMRLSSVWPVDFEYPSQSAAMTMHVKMADFTVGQGFRTFRELETRVYGRGSA